MNPPEFETWVLIEEPDEKSLMNVFTELGLYGKVALPRPPKIGLHKEGDKAKLTGTEAELERLFGTAKRKGQEKQEPALAVSLAPWDDVKFFGKDKHFFWDLEAYELLPAELNPPSPYQHRFLALWHRGIQIQSDRDTWGTIIELTRKPVGPPLWLEPIRLPMNTANVTALFGSAAVEGIDVRARRGVAAVTGSFFFPPVRTSPGPDSYFAEIFRDLRDVLRKDTPDYETPLNILALRLVDEFLIRDVFVDGGRLSVVVNADNSTKLALEFSDGPEAWKSHRRRVFLAPQNVTGPPWARQLAQALQNDIRSLVSGGRLALKESDTALSWTVELVANERFQEGPKDGTWKRFEAVCEAFKFKKAPRDIFFEFILSPSGPYGTRNGADNDMAEKLFLAHAWRCPWMEDPAQSAWHAAMMEQLFHWELAGVGRRYPTPTERVGLWNKQRVSGRLENSGSGGVRPRSSFLLHQRQPDGTWILDYSGDPTDEETMKWRLLLPLGAVINAKTIFLDRGQRSQLDRGFVLAP